MAIVGCAASDLMSDNGEKTLVNFGPQTKKVPLAHTIQLYSP